MLYNKKYSTGLIEEVVGKLDATAEIKNLKIDSQFYFTYLDTLKLRPVDK